MPASASASTEPSFEVLWPLSRKAVVAAPAAARLPDLNGRTICELWDMILRGELIFPLVRRHIEARYPDAKFVGPETFGDFYMTRERDFLERLPDLLRAHGCDAVVVGIGA